jgi:hypothetical protein
MSTLELQKPREHLKRFRERSQSALKLVRSRQKDALFGLVWPCFYYIT